MIPSLRALIADEQKEIDGCLAADCRDGDFPCSTCIEKARFLGKLQALLDATGEGKATAIAWPQDAAELIAMAREWPVPISDAGDMFTGDVLVRKLGNALEAALASADAAGEGKTLTDADLQRLAAKYFAESPERYARALALAKEVAALASATTHVCGLSGYNGMIDPPCPGCEAREKAFRGKAPTAGTWHPIASAPKDGTWVFAFRAATHRSFDYAVTRFNAA